MVVFLLYLHLSALNCKSSNQHDATSYHVGGHISTMQPYCISLCGLRWFQDLSVSQGNGMNLFGQSPLHLNSFIDINYYKLFHMVSFIFALNNLAVGYG